MAEQKATGLMNIHDGHIQRVRYLIESSKETDPKVLFRITALMRCDKIVAAKKLLGYASGDTVSSDVVLFDLATILHTKTEKHLKECKTCRTAKKRNMSR